MNMFLISVCWIYCAMIGVMQSGAIRTGSTVAKYGKDFQNCMFWSAGTQ